MCLAIYKPKNQKLPSKDKLKNAWATNPHGAGLAIIKNNQVRIIKGLMTLEALMAALTSESLKAFDVVIHFRWATSGPDLPPADLTHPFPISKKNSDFRALDFYCEKAIIHNGVMFQPMTKSFSDTAIFSRYLAFFPDVTDSEIKAFIKEDRMAIATSEGVRLIGDWSLIKGSFYSNEYSIEAPSLFSTKWDKKWAKLEKEYDEKWATKKASWAIEDEKENQDEKWAMWDSRRSIESEIEAAYNDPYYYNENSIGPADLIGLEYCPHCDSENTEFIGVKTKSFECLDCGTVYNETDFLISEIEKEITVNKSKVKKEFSKKVG